MDWNKIKTEERNHLSQNIDTLSTVEMLRVINNEDKKVAFAVENELEQIALAVDTICDALRRGGRLIYAGCGTSGRLGILDAVECPPTFSTDPELVVGLIAGGYPAIFKAIEGAEDSRELGRTDLVAIDFCEKDVLVGIAASGRTPYVLGAIDYAHEKGAKTVGVTCCPGSDVEKAADIAITPVPGPEVVTGSTRMKSGTAQKMVLNMLSTGTMIKLGKVYGNLMVDVKPSNEKLIHRCERIVCEAAGISRPEAVELLKRCGYNPKTAIVMSLCGVDAQEARELLDMNDGRISGAVRKVH